MKQDLIKDVIQGMLPYLNNAQNEKLQEVLQYTLAKYEVTEKQNQENNSEQNYVELFLSAKRIEGCSEKSLKYYKATIEAMLDELNKDVKHIVTDDIRGYLTEYQEKKKSSKVTIDNVNHTLVYYDHRTDGSKRGCYFNINTTKTPAGKRQVPMLDFVKEAFLMEKERQELLDIHCEAVVDGYTDFIFLNRFGQPQHQATLNKAIRRIIRDCNDEQFLKDENAKVLLPHFSCHSLRHTFTTRMCEAGVNVKVIQDTLGHKDISTTLNIYTDVTKELRRSEFEGLDSYFKNEYNKANEVL